METDKQLLTKTQLRALRLKPAPAQQPAARYWQGRGWVYQYDARQAQPMRPYRAPSAAQLQALAVGRSYVGTVVCPHCSGRVDRFKMHRCGWCKACYEQGVRAEYEQEWGRVQARAAQLLALDPLFLDTETTGLDEGAEVVEIAILDRHGAVLLESLVKPAEAVPAEASAIHGLTDAHLVDAPSWPDVGAKVAALLRGRAVISHHAAFDERMLQQTGQRHGMAAPAPASWDCTLQLLTDINDGRWPSLAVAMSLAGATRPPAASGRPHRAAYDAACCRAILHALAGQGDQ